MQQNEIVKDFNKHKNFIESFKDHPEYIKYIKLEDQTIYMIENIFKRLKENGYYRDFKLIRYCNPKLLNEDFILELIPDDHQQSIIREYLKNVPKHFMIYSLIERIKDEKHIYSEDVRSSRNYFLK